MPPPRAAWPAHSQRGQGASSQKRILHSWASSPRRTLSQEYQVGLESSLARPAALEAQADVWQREGQVVPDACADWAQLDLDVLAARKLVERQEAADRSALLQRERDRLDEARSVLASL